MMAKPWTTGFLGTSAPRMFSSQDSESGSVSTAARCSAARRAAAMRSRFSAAGSPATASGHSRTAPAGAGGWSVQTASIGFVSTAISATPDPASPFSISRISRRVCSQGS